MVAGMHRFMNEDSEKPHWMLIEVLRKDRNFMKLAVCPMLPAERSEVTPRSMPPLTGSSQQQHGRNLLMRSADGLPHAIERL